MYQKIYKGLEQSLNLINTNYFEPNSEYFSDLLSNYKNCNILVTGGAGFIGSHLTEELVKLGANVTVLDNLSNSSVKNLTKVNRKINFIYGSITDYRTCLKASKNAKIIFHLAAETAPTKYLDNPNKCDKTNIEGTLYILQAARENKIKNFIFSSSASVYGNQNGLCQETFTCSPISSYGYSKYIGEILCKEYADIYNINSIILRYFNVYGSRQKYTNSYSAVIPKFINNIKKNTPLIVYGDGKQTRDFISVTSVVKANLILGIFAEEFKGEIFNIASGISISLIELINILKTYFPKTQCKILFESERIGDIKHSKANCSKYFNLINRINSKYIDDIKIKNLASSSI